MNFREILENSYEKAKKNKFLNPPTSRLEFLGADIFDFVTYDKQMYELFARKAVEVCTALQQGWIAYYTKDPKNYGWYIVMCNMKFFAGKLRWETDIRSAWFAPYAPPAYQIDCKALWDGNIQLFETLVFTEEAWNQFIQAIIDFADSEMYPST